MGLTLQLLPSSMAFIRHHVVNADFFPAALDSRTPQATSLGFVEVGDGGLLRDKRGLLERNRGIGSGLATAVDDSESCRDFGIETEASNGTDGFVGGSCAGCLEIGDEIECVCCGGVKLEVDLDVAHNVAIKFVAKEVFNFAVEVDIVPKLLLARGDNDTSLGEGLEGLVISVSTGSVPEVSMIAVPSAVAQKSAVLTSWQPAQYLTVTVTPECNKRSIEQETQNEVVAKTNDGKKQRRSNNFVLPPLFEA